MMAIAQPLLSVDGLHSYYGRAHILDNVTLSAARGEVVVLLGRNGAGKTTTLKCLMGLVRPAQGTIRFGNRDITGAQPYVVARSGLGYVPEDRRIFTDLTVLENLEVGYRLARADAPEWSLERLFTLFPNLAEMRHRSGGSMSGGEQQMLTIARSLMGNPSAILLDEPSEGLAPVIVEQMTKTILDLKADGLTVILSEQNLHFADQVSDRAYIIEKGVIRYSGTMADLAADTKIRNTYLTV